MAINAIGQQNQIQQPQFNAISAGAQPALQRAGQQGGSCPMQCCGGATKNCDLPKAGGCCGNKCNGSVGNASGSASTGQANSTSDFMQMMMSIINKLNQLKPTTQA